MEKRQRVALLDVMDGLGGLLESARGGELHPQTKKDGTTVTIFDYVVQGALYGCLGALWPSSILLGEEGDFEKSLLAKSASAWLVDPIDGTAPFTSGLGYYTVTATYFEYGIPRCGVIYMPNRRKGWFASGDEEKGPQAWRIEVDAATDRLVLQEPEELAFKLPNGELKNAYLFVGSDAHRLTSEPPLNKWGGKIRALGASAGHLMLLADATPSHDPAAVLISRAKTWDISAGLLIAEARGLKLCDTHGTPLATGDNFILDYSNEKGKLIKPVLIGHAEILEHLYPASS